MSRQTSDDCLWTVETGGILITDEERRRSAVAHTRRQGTRYGYRGRIVFRESRRGRVVVGVER